MNASTVDLSIVVPIHNEAEAIVSFFENLKMVLDKMTKYRYEIICVDDGSKDGSLNILSLYAQQDKRIKVIAFSRNFGKEKAMYAGLEFCSGKVAVIIDADLQHPVDLIPSFVDKWEEGYDNVYGIMADRKKDFFIKRWLTAGFYKISNKMSEIPIYQNGGDFRLIDRKVIESIKQIHDNKLFMKYIYNWAGYRSIGIKYEVRERLSGKSKYSYWKLLNFALDGITASSTFPLRIWTYFGLIVVAMSFAYAAIIVFRAIIFGVSWPGYASSFTAIIFFGGLQLISLGIIGEYLGRVLEEQRKRPKYIISQKINF